MDSSPSGDGASRLVASDGLRSSQAKIGVSVPAANGHVGALAGGRNSAGVDGPAANGRSQVADVTSGPGVATERRRHVRVPVDGRAHIRYGHATISAGLVDLSEGGVRCVLPEASPMLAPGATVDGPFLLEAEVTTSRICLERGGPDQLESRHQSRHAFRRRLRGARRR